MHKTIGEALALVQSLKDGLPRAESVEVVVAPPFTALSAVGQALKETSIQLAAQNLHWADQGAYTGEISPAMLRDVGCRYSSSAIPSAATGLRKPIRSSIKKSKPASGPVSNRSFASVKPWRSGKPVGWKPCCPGRSGRGSGD